MPNNKKIGNQTGAVDLPTSLAVQGSFVSAEQYRFNALASWPKPVTGLVASVGDYIFVASSGTSEVASGLGYITAFGNEILASSYPELFDVIGRNYGNGDGATTFNVPKVWGDYGYLQASSTASGALSSGSIPDHTHTVAAQSATVAGVTGPGTNNVPWNGSLTLWTSTDGQKTNNARFKEVTPLIASQTSAQVPIGTVIQFFLPVAVSTAAAALPDSVLIASGQELSRAAYPTLFERLGVHYGSGDGSSNFNIPDYRGIFLRGPLASGVEQPNPSITGSGYVECHNAAHYHKFSVVHEGPTNSNTGPVDNGATVTGPATGPSSFGSIDGRPKNITCLNCIVVSGTV